MAKPLTPAREFIAPSDLTFGLSTCKRCLWIKYWYKLIMPGQFPLVGTLAESQEEHFRRASMQDIDPTLQPGVVKQWGQWVRSDYIKVDGATTRWIINGKYDLVAHYEDGSIGLIDCKVTDSDPHNGAFYAPQLEAYAFALEHPSTGKAFTVATMGLLVWNLNGVAENADASYGFGVNQSYLPVERDQEGFTTVISDFIRLLEADMPAAGSECPTCNYLSERLQIED